MQKAMAATMTALALTGGLFTGTAQAQDTNQLQDTIGVQLARCTDGTVTPKVPNLALRRQPSVSSTKVGTLIKGVSYGCGPLVLGGRYTACGVTNGNGWIPIDLDHDGVGDGYSASGCLND